MPLDGRKNLVFVFWGSTPRVSKIPNFHTIYTKFSTFIWVTSNDGQANLICLSNNLYKFLYIIWVSSNDGQANLICLSNNLYKQS